MPKRKKQILIVEDEPFLVEMYKARFEQEGYGVSVAFNGADVADIIKKEKPDIVLLDIVMPEVNGYEVLAELKKRKRHCDDSSSCFFKSGSRRRDRKRDETRCEKIPGKKRLHTVTACTGSGKGYRLDRFHKLKLVRKTSVRAGFLLG